MQIVTKGMRRRESTRQMPVRGTKTFEVVVRETVEYVYYVESDSRGEAITDARSAPRGSDFMTRGPHNLRVDKTVVKYARCVDSDTHEPIDGRTKESIA